MAVLKVELKQHTPIIHFQAHQDGATLRASELKPKLDKFLIEKVGLTETKNINGKNKKVPQEIYNTWFNNKEKLSLNYKVKIIYSGEHWKHYIEEPKKKENGEFIQNTKKEGTVSTKTDPYPLFFGNMGKNYKEDKSVKKFVFAKDRIELKIHSFIPDLVNSIQNCFHEFIAVENFGSRQDKGFGSFYIYENDPNYKSINENMFDYKFEITKPNNNDAKIIFKSLFNQIELFYRALRSGINIKEPVYEYPGGIRQIKKDTNGLYEYKDVFYFKSLLFLYFKNQDIQWEKKSIKKKFFLIDGTRGRAGSIMYYGLNTQIRNRPGSEVLGYANDNKKLVKDLLGLSTEESWLSYDKNIITKTEAKKNGSNEWVKKEGKEVQIERFKSPIQFKIIESSKNGKYIVYIKLDKEVQIRGKWFIIDEKSGRKPFPLQIPSNFDLNKFFEFITNKANFDIKTHVESRFHTDSKGNLTWQYEILKNIFDSLTKI